MQIYQGVFPTINGPVETMNLIYGGPQEFAPIVARSTEPYSVSGDPRFRPFIPLLPGVATMTDLSAVINGTGIKIFQSGVYELYLCISVPGTNAGDIWSHPYILEVPDEKALNKDFVLHFDRNTYEQAKRSEGWQTTPR